MNMKFKPGDIVQVIGRGRQNVKLSDVSHIAASLLFIVATVAIAGAAHRVPRANDTEARLPLAIKVSVFDPHKISEAHEFGIAEDLLEGLTTISATGRVIPGVASRWETTRDGLVWTFHLRDDARWSNGDPVTAEDFVYSFRREVAPATASPSAEALNRIAGAEDIRLGKTDDLTTLGVRALDKQTLRIALSAPTAWLPMLLTHFAALPVPQAQVAKFGEEWAKPGRMMGNGAYVLADVDTGGTVRLERNPFFHDAGSVKVPVIRFVPGPAPDEALQRFEAGEYDVVRLKASDVSRVATSHPSWLLRQPELATRFLAVNPANRPLNDPRVRRALSMTLDRERLIEAVEHSTNAPAYELVAPGLAGYTPQSAAWATESLAARLAEARRLLAQVSGGPIRVSLTFRNSPASQLLAAAIAETWGESLGVATTLVPVDGKTYIERLGQHGFELMLVSWDPDFADASNYLDGYRCDAGAANFGSYCDSAFDSLMTEASRSVDPVGRVQLLQSAERVLIDKDAVMPLAHGVLELVINPRLKGWDADPLSRHPSRYLRIEPLAPTPAAARQRVQLR
jgi:oligopeptide transport system substrate-binding protein